MTREKVIHAFKEKYNTTPSWITRSPGRVNIIGEHTDYNDGFVLPMAINYATWIAFRPRDDSQIHITALDMGEKYDFDLHQLDKGAGGWREYITGVAWALSEAGHQLSGWEGVISGNIPIGAGLSSSASLELALARAFALVSDLKWNPVEMALLCQKAENHWVGISSGIMDQLISAMGKKDHALLIDCRSLETQQIPLQEGTRIVILDTATRRGLVDSAYNERREQCEAVASYFNVKALRDITLDQLEMNDGLLNNQLYQRARHVISANQRVMDAVEMLKSGDAPALGQLMNESHTSMRDDFEISRDEMDHMVEIAQSLPGCYGARMTGGGFGGCAIALVDEDHVEGFQEEIVREYQKETGLEAKVYISRAAEGTSYEIFE
jgi:galactokinase